VDSLNRNFIVSLSFELENQELGFQVMNLSKNKSEFTNENVWECLADLSRFSAGRGFVFDFQAEICYLKEIEFPASHFNEMSNSELSRLSASILSKFFSSSCLRIESEDQLYLVVCAFIDRNKSYFSFLSFVRLEYLFASSILRFVESATDFLNFFNSSICSSVGRHLILPVLLEISSDRIAIRIFSPNSLSPLDGIISQLISVSDDNVYDSDIVLASASASGMNGAHDSWLALDLQNPGSCFQSNGHSDDWIRYDFKRICISPTHYSILPYPYGPGSHNPKSWCFEISDDGNNCIEVHRCTDNNDLNGNNLIWTYEVTKSMQCWFVRLRQTGKSHYGNDYWSLNGLEIFETLDEV
jgi:hypothetical protein